VPHDRHCPTLPKAVAGEDDLLTLADLVPIKQEAARVLALARPHLDTAALSQIQKALTPPELLQSDDIWQCVDYEPLKTINQIVLPCKAKATAD